MILTSRVRGNSSLFSRILREEMKKKNIKPIDIAHTLDVSPQYISDVLHDRRAPLLPSDIKRLCDTYGLDYHALMTARAWTRRSIDIPHFCRYEEVEKVVKGLAAHIFTDDGE